MKHSHFVTIILSLSLTLLFENCSNSESSNSGKSTYISEIQSIRDQKDLEFKNDKESPIEFDKREGFTGLRYFPINETWKVLAAVKIIDQGPDFEMAYTDGEIAHMLNVADLIFEINNEEYLLHSFLNANNPNSKTVFIPFYDDSNGNSTYGGGRYLDIPLNPSQDSVWLDFNLAYNPYCVYNERYVCPIPPENNYLELQIEAGEMK